MRLIDAERLKDVMIETLEKIKQNPKMDNQEAHIISAFHTVGLMVEDAPTIDAVSVVRCKDCKHSHPWYADRRTCELWTETGVDVFNDGFCSYGERKDNE